MRARQDATAAGGSLARGRVHSLAAVDGQQWSKTRRIQAEDHCLVLKWHVFTIVLNDSPAPPRSIPEVPMVKVDRGTHTTNRTGQCILSQGRYTACPIN